MPVSQRKARLLRRLAVNRSRARAGRVPVEGVRAVREALEAGASTSFAVVSPRLASLEDGRVLARLLTDRLGDAVYDVTDAEMAEFADTDHPQGVLLVCAEPTVELESALEGATRVLLLDAVQDPGNVGTLVRSAVAFSFDLVVALDGTADPWSAKAVRASAGMVFRVPVARASVREAVAALTAAGLPVFVASAEGTAAVEPRGDGFALALGNEAAGVRARLREVAAATVAVPMPGPAESLNVGIAGSILMSHLSRSDR